MSIARRLISNHFNHISSKKKKFEPFKIQTIEYLGDFMRLGAQFNSYFY